MAAQANQKARAEVPQRLGLARESWREAGVEAGAGGDQALGLLAAPRCQPPSANGEPRWKPPGLF